AEAEVVDSLTAIAALPVQIDRDDARAFAPAHGKVADRAGRRFGYKVLLPAADAGGYVPARDAAFRHDVAAVDVAHLAVVHHAIGAVVASFEHRRIGKERVLEGSQLKRGG